MRLRRLVGSLLGHFVDDVRPGSFSLLITGSKRERFRNSNWRDKAKSAYSSHFFGSFCFSFSTASKRSPIFSTRVRVLSERNFNKSAFFFFRQLATSSQVTGVETVGSSFARSE